MSPDSPSDIAPISDDNSSIDSSSHAELSESKGRVWPNYPRVADVCDCDCDSVLFIGPDIVDSDPNPSPPFITPEEIIIKAPWLDLNANNKPGSKDSDQYKMMTGSNSCITPTFHPPKWLI